MHRPGSGPPVPRLGGWGRRVGAGAGRLPSVDAAIDDGPSRCAQVHTLRPVMLRCGLRQEAVSSRQVTRPFSDVGWRHEQGLGA